MLNTHPHSELDESGSTLPAAGGDSGGASVGGLEPFFKWAGGKRRHVSVLEPQLGLPARRLVEPFSGSCAVSLALHHRADSLWLNDTNRDLIQTLEQLAVRPANLLDRVTELFDPENNRADKYFQLRMRFNAARDPFERAALFVYLNRHCFNGLCRYNMQGEFNVPFGRYKAPIAPIEAMRQAAPVLSKARITCQDFEPVLDACGEGDAVYCDPPFVPLSQTANFTEYSPGGFSLRAQRRLAAAADRAARRGATVVVSNHDTAETREMFAGAAQTLAIDVRRRISCDANNRGLARELIAVYRPPA